MRPTRSWFRPTAVLGFTALALLLTACGEAGAPILAPEQPRGPQLAIGSDPVSGASIETNKDDYVPGEIVHLVLKGWAPGEDVRLVMTEDPDTHADVDTTITVNAQGEWSGHFYDVQEHDLGVEFTLTGTGLTSGSTAVVVFYDGNLNANTAVALLAPAGPPCGTPIAAPYPVDVELCAKATLGVTTTGSGPNATTASGSLRWFKGVVQKAAVNFTNLPNGAAVYSRYTPDEAGTDWSVKVCNNVYNGSNGCGSEWGPLTFTVTAPASNAPPSVSGQAADATGNEGSALTTSGAFEDADGDALTITKVSGLGTVTDNGDGTWSWSLTPTDNGSGSVTVQADDGEGGTVTDEFDWTAANVAPTVTGVTAPASIDEGGTINFSASGVTDPSSDDVTAGFEYAFSCDGGTTFGSYGTNNSSTCSAPDGPATITVAVKAKDKDGGESSAVTANVTVNNVAPTVVLTGPVSSNEGETQSYSYSFTDPGADTWTHTTSCGANGTKSDDLFSEAGKSGSFKCTWTDNYAGQVVSAKVADDDTGEDTDTRTVNIANVAPTLTSVTGPAGPVQVGTTVSLALVFSDPAGANDDPFSVQVNWDGTGYVAAGTLNHGGGTVTRTYATAGVNTVCAKVTDKDGGVSNILCYEFVIVYDPDAGFVTGGGWINSPAGAYVADPSLVGKATFGFVSKYLKGRTTPTGNTEFQFHAGGLNFSSSSYEWLVVNQSGENAQFKGVGSLNGVGGHQFMLWAKDGSPDTFRIKISTSGGTVVYDNLQNGEFGTPLGGGSIMIHTPKK